jgi:hypothetical protein
LASLELHAPRRLLDAEGELVTARADFHSQNALRLRRGERSARGRQRWETWPRHPGTMSRPIRFSEARAVRLMLQIQRDTLTRIRSPPRSCSHERDGDSSRDHFFKRRRSKLVDALEDGTAPASGSSLL